MQQVLDFLTLVMFYAVYKLYDIYYASIALIIASSLVLLYTWLRYRKVGKVALITFVLMVLCGSLTFYYHNEAFIKWKVTMIYTLCAAALLISQFLLGRPIIQFMLLNKELHLPARIVKHLSIAWAVFFLACGALNIYIAFWLPQSVWVYVKVFGFTSLILLFTLLSGVYVCFALYCKERAK